jgi:2-dehydropantoate 2-reductase
MHSRILVVGAGAIGGFYGGKLAQAGCRVSVVSRSDYEVVKSEGIAVTSALGDFRFIPEKVIREVAEYGEPPDYILVGTKVVPETDTVKLIRPVVGPGTAIVLIQNGVEIEQPIAEAFPQNEIISGLAFIAVSRIGPGRIHHQAYGRLTLGLYPSGSSEKAARLAELLESTGVPAELTMDVVTARWRKLVWNAPFNPVSVLGGGVDTTMILGNPEAARLIRKVMEEVCLVAKATGHELPPTVIQENIDGTLAIKPYKTSMLLDFEAGRPMEVEAILGNGVRAARREGVAVPHMESLYALLLLADQKNRSKIC